MDPQLILLEDIKHIRATVDRLDEKFDHAEALINARLTPLESFVNRVKGVLAVAVVGVPILGAVGLAALKGDIKW